MVVFTYKTRIEAPIEEVWAFFSTAENLAKITSFPKVSILSGPETRQGNLIQMQLRFVCFSLKWESLIKEVQAPHFFIDKGVKLPFPFLEWQHKHVFHVKGEYTIMEDIVEFRSVVPSYLTKPLLLSLFRGREKAIRKEFGLEVKS
ncbi:hypothetical protein N0O92_15790 [Alkalihalobacillus sp. MEB130]|uniref:SRPBCC family protein n=1 Tax=Alkalihalobacillus sp. MEB130 TaxID=2976704 RepID=UPI0028DF6DD0|nr:hypothetical protein [Alkalihalobacillus sp. MEB130]MDT8861680.1 hypothetical protein [Alkalihalobacillus sp. MEB130]